MVDDIAIQRPPGDACHDDHDRPNNHEDAPHTPTSLLRLLRFFTHIAI